MKIQQVHSPHAIAPVQTNVVSQADARARAIAAMTPPANPTAQEHPVADPNNISPEELSAVRAPTQDAGTQFEATSTEQSQPVQENKQEDKDPALIRQYNQLARQERALRQKAQAQAADLQKQMDAFKAEKAQFEARIKQFEDGYVSRDRIKADPLGTYEESGVTYDDVSQQALTRQPIDPSVKAYMAKMEAKIADLEAKNENTVKTFQDQQGQAREAAIGQIKRDAAALVKSDPEQYEAISKYPNGVKEVVDYIVKKFDKTGEVLTVEEAADAVENFIVEETLPLTRLNKIKKRLEQTNASNGQAQKTQQNSQTQPQMKTLTNAASSTRKLSARERALLAFKGELKS